MSSTNFLPPEVTIQAHGTALLGMTTDNLSGAKGTTQSSAIIWLSLNPSLSMSGAPRHHPIANLWYLSLTPDNQSGRCIGTPLFMPSAPKPKAQCSFFFKLLYITDVYYYYYYAAELYYFYYSALRLLQSCGVLQYCVLWYIV